MDQPDTYVILRKCGSQYFPSGTAVGRAEALAGVLRLKANTPGVYALLNLRTKIIEEDTTGMARAGRDEVLRSELDAQLADIYDVLSDPDLRDYVGAIDVAINQHIALTDSMQSRAELLDALIAECGKRMAMAMAASRTFVGPSYRYRKDDSYTNCLISAHGGAKIKRERSPTFLIYQGRLARVAFFI